jgi:alpha-tubulin suppressor-like RCC1 family protein
LRGARTLALVATLAVGGMLALGALGSGCLPQGDYHCDSAGQCGANAFCEIDGRCSAGDVTCPAGRRYLDQEGDLSNVCVGITCDGNRLTAVAAGVEHACAVRADGTVSCWGRNDDGELGDSTHTPRSTAGLVMGVADAKAIAAGARHTCAATTSGAVFCWGADDSGQLGDGGGASRATPIAVAGITHAVDVAAGAAFSCAVLADGTAQCWGDNSQGQLGDGGPATAGRAPTPVFALTDARTISASTHGQHACALRDDETLWCWGANNSGQLGDGSTTARPQPAPVQALQAVTSVSAGLLHTCAATRADGMYCWGANNSGQLGHEGAVPEPSPVKVPLVTDAVAVAAGDGHTCAIRQSGQTLCWGANGDGQLGEGSTSGLPIPTAVTGLDASATIVGIVAGGLFSCARDGFGAVFCWGDDHYGELGTGREIVRASAAPVASVAGAVDLATGGQHTCVATLTKDDTTGVTSNRALCWGANNAGQLGDGMTDDRGRAAPVAGDVEAVTVAAGLAHSCAIARDGALFCWGRGSAGQLGPNHLIDTPAPTPIALASGAGSVAAGDMHTCAALTDGSAWCWGDNTDGQLGDGTTTDRAAPGPVQSPAGATIDAVTAGGGHTCALAGGDILCWGRGAEGQVGDGAGAARAVPVGVTLGTSAAPPKASAVAAGADHSCALAADGGVWSWGDNADGQLGTGSPTVVDLPTAVTSLAPGALGVAAGAAHTCAINDDATVSCWGANDDGQLGTGHPSSSPVFAPTLVQGLADVAQLGAGGAHTCARRHDGSVWCWGANDAGQLGEEDALWEVTPRLARLACH